MIRPAIRTVYIAGLGAIGASYAAQIYKRNPHSVKVVLDRERKARYEKSGVIVNNERYDFQYVVSEENEEKADLILIAVKGHHLKETIEGLHSFVGENTLILSLLNGITSETVLGEAFGSEKILHAFCVATDAIREDLTITFSRLGRIVFGDKENPGSERALGIKAFLDAFEIPNELPENILRELWWKFMMNVGLNQTSAVLGAPYGVYQKVDEARELMLSVCREVIPLAKKEGILLTEEDLQAYVTIIHTLSPTGKTSMLQDVEAKRKTEVESFAKAVIDLGYRHGVDTPLNQMLYRMIRTLEYGYGAIQ